MMVTSEKFNWGEAPLPSHLLPNHKSHASLPVQTVKVGRDKMTSHYRGWVGNQVQRDSILLNTMHNNLHHRKIVQLDRYLSQSLMHLRFISVKWSTTNWIHAFPQWEMSHRAGVHVGYNGVPLVPCTVLWDVKFNLCPNEVDAEGRGPELPSKHTQKIVP